MNVRKTNETLTDFRKTIIVPDFVVIKGVEVERVEQKIPTPLSKKHTLDQTV